MNSPDSAGEINVGLGSFFESMTELDIFDKVTALTCSVFSRTFQPNSSNGTDHARGSHHIIIDNVPSGKEKFTELFHRTYLAALTTLDQMGDGSRRRVQRNMLPLLLGGSESRAAASVCTSSYRYFQQ
jgi:hypothetical protein